MVRAVWIILFTVTPLKDGLSVLTLISLFVIWWQDVQPDKAPTHHMLTSCFGDRAGTVSLRSAVLNVLGFEEYPVSLALSQE